MDLLNQLGKKGEGKAAETSITASTETAIVGSDATSDKLKRGEDIIAKTGSVTEVQKETTPAPTPDKTVQNPEDWTKDSALKEVLKLREENKAIRTKVQDQLDKINKETQEKIEQIKKEAESALEAKKQLEALKAEQEDKKRSIEDKLAHREARLTEVELAYKQKLEEKEKEVESYKSKAIQYEAEQEARKQVYRDRIKEDIDSIPEDFRQFAEKMVKGYEDPHEGWLALAEAKQKGLFGEKKIVVNHSVPGAADGARVNSAKIQEEEREARKKMGSRALIKAGLEKAKTGTNTAFRGR